MPNHSLCLRYVDNHLCIVDETQLEHRAVTDFKQLDFYAHGIQLETVDDHSLLGFKIDCANRTVSYVHPSQSWQLRHVHSAGSWRIKAAGFASRAALIRKYTWPPSARPAQVRRLRQFYEQAGFPGDVLHG